MDTQNTITFHAEISQSEIAPGENLFLWDNYGSPFDDFFVYQPPPVQTDEVFDASASTNLQLLSSWDFSLPDLGANLGLSTTQDAAGVAIAAEGIINNDLRNGPMSVLQSHPSFQSVQGAAATIGCNVNKNNARGNAHLQSKMFKSAGEQSANEKLNDYYLWNMYRDGKTRKLFSLGQYKWMSKTKYNTRYNDKKLKQLVVLTKENATLKYRNKLYKEEIKRLQAIERRIVEELKIN